MGDATGEASVKIVVVNTDKIEVVTEIDITGGSVFANGTAEAIVGVMVSIDRAVTVRVLGGMIDVALKVEVTAAGASVDVCEPISRYPQQLKISSSRELVLALVISKNENNSYLSFWFICIWVHELIGIWPARLRR